MALKQILLLLVLVFAIHGEQVAAEDAMPPDQTLQELQTLIETEASQLERDRLEWQQELQTQKTLRRQLAQEVLERELEKTALFNQSQQIKLELSGHQEKASMLEAFQVSVDGRLAVVAEQLVLSLSEIPGSQEPIEKILAQDSWLGHARNILAGFSDYHFRAGRITIEEREIYTAEGQLEKVQLLSVGQNIFVYRRQPDHQIGFALNSPSDASGFRWSEQIGRQQQKSLDAVFEQVAREEAGWLEIPVDVSGQLSVDSGRALSLRSGGPVMIPLAIVTLLAIILIIERSLYLFRNSQDAESLLRNVLSSCKDNNYDQALTLCENSSGVVSRILMACLKRRPQGQQAMEDSIQEQLLHEMPRCQRCLGGIMALGGVAPLLGLLGTVTGIIKTFAAIQSYGQPQPGLMATGISEALMTTAAGLIVAIPTLLLHRVLSGQADKLISDGEKSAATLLNTLLED